MFKTKYFQMYSVFYKKRSSLKFFLKTFIKKGDKLRTFCSSKVGVGKIARRRGSEGIPPQPLEANRDL